MVWYIRVVVLWYTDHLISSDASHLTSSINQTIIFSNYEPTNQITNQITNQTHYHDGPPIPDRPTSIPQPSCLFICFLILLFTLIVEHKHIFSNYRLAVSSPTQTMRDLHPNNRFIHPYLWKRLTPFMPTIRRQPAQQRLRRRDAGGEEEIGEGDQAGEEERSYWATVLDSEGEVFSCKVYTFGSLVLSSLYRL